MFRGTAIWHSLPKIHYCDDDDYHCFYDLDDYNDYDNFHDLVDLDDY